MEMEADFKRLTKKGVEMGTFVGRAFEKSSSVLEFCVNWEEIHAGYDSIGDCLKKRETEIELKEKSVVERILELEKKEERLGNVEELEMKQILESSILRLVLEKTGEEVIEELEEKRQEVKCRELEKEKEAELVENSLKQLEVREQELREKVTALEKREEIFEAKQKEKAEEMESKSMLLELMEKELEEREKEVEQKQMEVEERSKQGKTSKRSRVECTDTHLAKRHKPLVREHMNDGESKETDLACVASVSSVEVSEANGLETEVFVSKDGTDEDPEPLICADSEFNDFRKTMNSFVVGKIWALYDSLDDMPRWYARIKKVNKSRLSLRVTWLEPKEEQSVPMACGRFEYGKTETISHLVLSHEMNPITSRYIITLNPRKGETWALFRDWKNNPKQHKPPYRYDFVEILLDFDASYGIGVSYLGKVQGFPSVFKHAGQHGVVSVMIQPEEMHRFSHRVPCFRLNGEEKEGVPDGSFELDPAAIPDSTLLEEVEESERQIEGCDKASEFEDQDGLRREIHINLD